MQGAMRRATANSQLNVNVFELRHIHPYHASYRTCARSREHYNVSQTLSAIMFVEPIE